MRTKVEANVLFALVLVGAAAIALVRVSGNAPVGSDDHRVLPPEDVARIGVHVAQLSATDDLSGLIGRTEALEKAAARWGDQGGIADPFLMAMTDPGTSRDSEPVTDRPVWIVRYSDISIISPGGRELHYAYVVIDGLSGVELYTTWSP